MNVLPNRAFALVASSTFRSLVLACACLAIAAQSPAFSQGAAEVSFQQLYRKFGSSGDFVAGGGRFQSLGVVECRDGNTLCALCPVARDRRRLAG
jgi:hypothetical protein